ncbi:peroxiredoxin [Chitinivibrio alkaliphilus]|uniref:Thioredoxin peroxidase n=1 Tax=Chitinivibrio alkaliphilus ACht1 TaxID=1313304 RepID=U7D8E8_9BACT|nr:peroxiredoxin [Chitinivibrio alkaliphilus]ERP31347.1 thioredoxin peroxidase [Chitinivibrio alkaliphilus ACht1]
MSVLVGKKAPSFTTTAVQENRIIENFSLSQYQGKYILLFFYPLDFTFVCPTELHAFNEKLDEFAQRDVQLIGASTDSHFSHLAWLNTPVAEGGISGVKYPIIADKTADIARDFDVLVEDAGIAYRGLFLIDREGTVRHQVVNDLPLGRSVDEALRIVDALQYTEKYGEVCPANWNKGDTAMKPDSDGLKDFFGEK